MRKSDMNEIQLAAYVRKLEYLRKYRADPECREKAREYERKRYADPEHRERWLKLCRKYTEEKRKRKVDCRLASLGFSVMR